NYVTFWRSAWFGPVRVFVTLHSKCEHRLERPPFRCASSAQAAEPDNRSDNLAGSSQVRLSLPAKNETPERTSISSGHGTSAEPRDGLRVPIRCSILVNPGSLNRGIVTHTWTTTRYGTLTLPVFINGLIIVMNLQMRLARRVVIDSVKPIWTLKHRYKRWKEDRRNGK